MILSVSILDADFGALDKTLLMLEESEAEWIHCDVMDGVFVPNLSFGIPVIKSIRKHTEKPLDVHLMMVEPERYIHRFREAGADIITIHAETSRHLHMAVQTIRESGAKIGVCLNPATPLSVLEEILPDIDMVLLMSVNPGFGGQPFITNTLNKVIRLREMSLKLNPGLLIEVDGGLNENNIPLLKEAGADIMVAGSYILRADDPLSVIRDIKAI